MAAPKIKVGKIRADQVRAKLLAWYDAHRRALPWRATPGERPDPYRVWLSEIMLQQTTVPHATPYFLAFVSRWPAVADLAAAAGAEVMAAWAGLGYYARARNLLACARAVVSDHGGRFPASEAALRTLPGVGAYTAAAIAAIAFDEPANAVDGNIERVVARVNATPTPLPDAKPELRRLAGELVRDHRPGDWAQAMMDLGATVCRPTSPLCDVCPIAKFCRALATGAPETYPRRAPKTPRPHRHGVAFRLMNGGEVGMVRRPPKGLLGGMLALPTTPWRAEPWTRAEALADAPTQAAWRRAGAVEHVFTHFSLTLEVFEAEVRDAAKGDHLIWTALAEALRAAPSVFARALTVGI
ncbi:MAG TPA: A/G-specific adenine glycosylase [Caulobacteraceae bacterium]|jgi:A/G-specific adenine glycosylase